MGAPCYVQAETFDSIAGGIHYEDHVIFDSSPSSSCAHSQSDQSSERASQGLDLHIKLS